MLFTAFTIGLLGSLHCVGMCGPLAMSLGYHGTSKSKLWFDALTYQLGRIISYSMIGIVMGLVSNALWIGHLQKVSVIVIGSVLVGFFILRQTSRKVIFLSQWNQAIVNKLYKGLSKFRNHGGLTKGMINGLVPCGLVYLACAGSLTMGSALGGAYFMIAFGMGTAPAMIFMMIGLKRLSKSKGWIWDQVLPYTYLLSGVILLYRGVYMQVPDKFNFWQMMMNPTMCH